MLMNERTGKPKLYMIPRNTRKEEEEYLLSETAGGRARTNNVCNTYDHIQYKSHFHVQAKFTFYEPI